MNIIFLNVLFVMSICLSSCGQGDEPKKKMYDLLLQQGFKKIPDVGKVKQKFDSVSFIANYGNQFATPQWQTVFYIDGWYECTYVHNLEIKDEALFLKGTPKLHINEVTKVDGATLHYGRQRILQGKDLIKFIDSGFDLKSVGMSPKIKRNPPAENLMQYWHNLYPK